MARRNSPSLHPSRNSSYGSLGLRPGSGRASPSGLHSRSPSSSPRPEHRRKSSISSLIAGALIPREKSPAPKEEVTEPEAKGTGTSRKKEKTIPPPVASKPGWLKRTASAGKIMITGGSPKESSPAGSPLAAQAPSLPPRKAANSLLNTNMKTDREQVTTTGAPVLPKRHSPSASISIPSGKPSNNLDHRASLAVDLGGAHSQAGGRVNLKTATSFEDSLLPPPSRSSVHLPTPSDPLRGHHSLDAPRTLSQIGANGLTTVNPTGLASGLRTGFGAVNRRIGAWSQETGAASNTKGYLQAGGGVIGSAVSSGWSAFRNSKSSAPPSSMSSGIGSSTGRSGSNMSLATNGGKGALNLNGMDGPTIEASLFKRQAPVPGVKGEVFGRDLREAALKWPIEDSSLQAVSSTTGRKRRIASLPAVALRCVDHRKSSVTLFLSLQED